MTCQVVIESFELKIYKLLCHNNYLLSICQVRSIRMSGSCALNLCGIACGRLDVFYEAGFGGPWYEFLLHKFLGIIIVLLGQPNHWASKGRAL
jgi:hypothetical protein